MNTYSVSCNGFSVPLTEIGDYQVVCRTKEGEKICTSAVLHASMSHSPARISIFGSCTTRDCFRIFPSSAFKLRSYVARESVVSAVSKPIPLELDAIHLTSQWQKTAVWQDFNKTAFDMFRNDGSEWLMIDLIDERFALTRIGDTYVTKSSVAVESGVLSDEDGTVPRVSNGKDYFVDKKCLREYIFEFGRRILEIYAPDHIIIHRATAIEYYKTSEGKLCRYPSEGTDRNLNNLINYMYLVLKEVFPQAHEIECISWYYGSESHVWGLASVHYEDGYYAEVMKRLGEIIYGHE